MAKIKAFLKKKKGEVISDIKRRGREGREVREIKREARFEERKIQTKRLAEEREKIRVSQRIKAMKTPRKPYLSGVSTGFGGSMFGPTKGGGVGSLDLGLGSGLFGPPPRTKKKRKKRKKGKKKGRRTVTTYY